MSRIKAFYIWAGIMFPYGLYRGLKSTYETPNDLIHDKIVHSMFNGMMYASPVGIIKLIHFAGRIELFLTMRNPHLYPHLYQELSFKNKNII
jgi:hypothetical protein